MIIKMKDFGFGHLQFNYQQCFKILRGRMMLFSGSNLLLSYSFPSHCPWIVKLPKTEGRGLVDRSFGLYLDGDIGYRLTIIKNFAIKFGSTFLELLYSLNRKKGFLHLKCI